MCDRILELSIEYLDTTDTRSDNRQSRPTYRLVCLDLSRYLEIEICIINRFLYEHGIDMFYYRDDVDLVLILVGINNV